MKLFQQSFTLLTFCALAYTLPVCAQIGTGQSGGTPQEKPCDATLSGQQGFADLQALLNSSADPNSDGLRVICIQGTVVNDVPGGDPNLTLETGYTGPIEVRGLSALGVPAVIRKIVSGQSHDLLGSFSAGNLTLKNLRFEHQGDGGSLAALTQYQGVLNLKDIEIVLSESDSPNTLALNIDGQSTVEDLTIDLQQTQYARAIRLGDDFYSTVVTIDGLEVVGSGSSRLLRLDDGLVIPSLENVHATGLGDGLRLDGWGAGVERLSNVHIETTGTALYMKDLQTFEEIENVHIEGCGMYIYNFSVLGPNGIDGLTIVPANNC